MPLTPLEEKLYEKLHRVKLQEIIERTERMKLTNRHVSIIRTLHERNLDLAHGTDDERRKLTKMIAQQLHFDSGDSNWGTKAQSPSHPQSKDAIAYRIDFSLIEYWDWQNGATRAPQVHVGQEGSPTNQHFIPVNPVNHIGSTPNPVPPPNNDDNENPEDSKIQELLEDILANQNRILENQGKIMAHLLAPRKIEASEFPNYSLKIFGQRVTLTPEPK